jgi:hypothetical protein
MQLDAPLSLATTDPDRPGLEIRVNFGIFAGRGATQAEIDDLGAELIPQVGEVSIVAEERHELSEESEAALHQVRIEIEADRLPPPGDMREALLRRLVDASERWARACIAERHVEVTEP